MFWKKVIRANILILLEKSIKSSADTYCAEIAKVIEGKAEQVAAHGLFYDGTFIREIYNTLQRELDTYFDITFGEINKLQSDLNILINDQEFAEIEKILQRTYRSLVGFNNQINNKWLERINNKQNQDCGTERPNNEIPPASFITEEITKYKLIYKQRKDSKASDYPGKSYRIAVWTFILTALLSAISIIVSIYNN